MLTMTRHFRLGLGARGRLGQEAGTISGTSSSKEEYVCFSDRISMSKINAVAVTPEEIAAEWPAGDGKTLMLRCAVISYVTDDNLDVFDKEGLPDVIWDDRPVDSPEEIRAKYYKVLFNTGRDAVCGKCGAACAKCGAKDNQKIENP